MPARRRPLLGAALVVSAAILWSTFGLFAKALYARGFDAIELASLRAWVGFLALFLAACVRPSRLRIAPREIPFFALYGIVGFALFETLYFASVRRTTVSVAAALLYTAPAFVVVLARVLWREAVPPVKLVALALVLVGVVLVTGAAKAVLTGSAALPLDGALLGLATGVSYALYTILSKLALDRRPPLTALLWAFAFAAISLTPFAPPLAAAMRDPTAIPLLVVLGLVPTVIAYFLYLRALEELSASTASMLAAIEPVSAAVLAAILIGERIDATQIVGVGAIFLAAVVLAMRAREDARKEVAGAVS